MIILESVFAVYHADIRRRAGCGILLPLAWSPPMTQGRRGAHLGARQARSSTAR